jgi:hypothetical protein
MDRAHIDNLGFFENMNFPRQVIRLGSFHQMIKGGGELFIARMAGGKLVILTQGFKQALTVF